MESRRRSYSARAIFVCFVSLSGIGSSPRVRGIRQHSESFTRQVGIIPACAGNTPPRRRWWEGCRDHPRVCGEHAMYRRGRRKGPGSSPRVRGTPAGHPALRVRPGIIPACAGNTCSRSLCTSESSDHPRVCGEHCAAIFTALAIAGSSPRVRGTPLQKPILRHQGGIIPACAGNTPLCTVRVTGAWGSSPRVRGTLCPCRKNHYVTGIIPACAGNTPRPRHVGRMGRDHPRVCGEHASAVSTASPSSGSSPRVRGTLLAQVRVRGEGGIIPACAGNTMTSRCPARSAWDHPRVCGEHHGEQRVHDRGKGSSPRVRGTLPVDCLVAQVVGIIPACAGNTNVGLKSNNTSGDHPRVCGEHVRLTSLGL